MADILQITLPDGTTYNIKDNNALPLTGGQITGPVTFGDSVSMDDLTAGNVIITGALSLVQGLPWSSITSTPTTLVGYGITDANFLPLNGGTLTGELVMDHTGFRVDTTTGSAINYRYLGSDSTNSLGIVFGTTDYTGSVRQTKFNQMAGYLIFRVPSIKNGTLSSAKFMWGQNSVDASLNPTNYFEYYSLPDTTNSLTATVVYDILTSKNAVTIAQGGTGATDATGARTNLGLAAAALKGVDTSITASSTSTNLPTSSAVADLIDEYLPLEGGNMSGPVTTSSYFNMGGGNFKIKYGSTPPASASLDNNDIYFCTGEVSVDVNAIAFDGDYSPETNKAATVSSVTSRIGNRKLFYGTCDTAAATTEKTVICPEFTAEDLVAGTEVVVKFSVTNSGAVASLTLNVNETGAANIKYIANGAYANIPAVGYIAANQVYQFTYDGTYWVVEMNYNTNTVPDRIYHYYALTKAYTALYRYMICFTKNEEYILPVNAVSNTTGTSKVLTTEEFDPFGEIFYYNSTSTVSAGSTPGNSLLYPCTTETLVDLRYSFNTGKTLTAKKPIYVVCVPQNNGKVKLASAPISQNLPTTQDGKVYIKIGLAYDTYRIILFQNKPVYYYVNGAIREWTNSAGDESAIYTELSRNKDVLTIKAYGIEKFQGTPKIFVYTCPRRKSKYYWRHPVSAENTVPTDPTTGNKIGCKYGYASLAGGNTHYRSRGDEPLYPSVPNWMTNNGWLTTEFTLSSNTLTINISDWIIPLVRPRKVNNALTWTKTGLMGVQEGNAPLLFKFFVVDYIDANNYKVYETTKSTLKIGIRRNATLNVNNGVISPQNLYVGIK